MRKKISIYFVSCLFILFSCGQIEKCNQACLDKELNNGNTDPEKLIVELNHSSIINAFGLAYGKLGCTGVGNGASAKGNTLNCDVEIIVNTASGVAGSSPVIDKDVYFREKFENQAFKSTASGTEKNTYNISVPKTGAFQVQYNITSKDCNQCCSGGGKTQCGASGSSSGMCKEGKPVIRLSTIYLSNTRPSIELNVIPGENGDKWGVTGCDGCSTCPERKCY
jgi:hypothetical protein